MRQVSLHAHSLAEMFQDVLKAGRKTRRTAQARKLVARLKRRVRAVAERSRGLKPLRVFCMEWIDPVFTTGHWVPEMIRLAGGREGLAKAGSDSRRIEWRNVVSYAPERLIIMLCGLTPARARRDALSLPQRPGWASIPAVRDGHVYVVDGPSYFNGAGPRLVDGLETLARIIRAKPYGSVANLRIDFA